MMKKFFGVMILLAMIFVTQNVSASTYLTYQAHVQDKGWMRPVSSGQTAGTTHRDLRLEALIINCDGIEYNARIKNIGWQGWRYSGDVAGTVGEGLRMEAIRIRLTGSMASRYDVRYRVHVQNIGWQNWVKNGAVAGTEGQHLRIEAIQIELVEKGSDYGYRRDRYDDGDNGYYDSDGNYHRDYRRHKRSRYDNGDNGYYDSDGNYHRDYRR